MLPTMKSRCAACLVRRHCLLGSCRISCPTNKAMPMGSWTSSTSSACSGIVADASPLFPHAHCKCCSLFFMRAAYKRQAVLTRPPDKGLLHAVARPPRCTRHRGVHGRQSAGDEWSAGTAPVPRICTPRDWRKSLTRDLTRKALKWEWPNRVPIVLYSMTRICSLQSWNSSTSGNSFTDSATEET